jgi:hypothetical protein
MLIIGRAIAGLGSSGLINGGLTIIAASVPLVKRPSEFSLYTPLYGLYANGKRSDVGLHDVNCTVRHCWRTINRRRIYSIRILALV